MDKSSEDWRHRTEAREWLKRGYTSREKVDGLMIRIAKHRGEEAAERLREGMRVEFKQEEKL